MDWGKMASGQSTSSSQPYLIPRSYLLSGTQIRGFKHNQRTCPNWTLDPSQGGGLPSSQGRIPGNQ